MSQAMSWYQLSHTGEICSLSNPANPYQPLPLTPNYRGMAYGDGFFTTMGVYQGYILWQDYHKARIEHHLNALFLHLPAEHQKSLWQSLATQAKHMEHGIIKVIVTRQQPDLREGLRGYAFSPNLSDNTCHIWMGLLSSSPLAKHTASFLYSHESVDAGKTILQQPAIVATCLKAQLASPPHALAGIKSLNKLDSVLIAGELEQRKLNHPELAEGLVRDLNGTWVEGVMSNVFYQLKGIEQWFTPPIESSGVNGVMRQVIQARFDLLGEPVQIRSLTDDDLPNLKALFFCNAVRGVIPVRRLFLLSGQSIDLSLDAFKENSVSNIV